MSVRNRLPQKKARKALNETRKSRNWHLARQLEWVQYTDRYGNIRYWQRK